MISPGAKRRRVKPEPPVSGCPQAERRGGQTRFRPVQQRRAAVFRLPPIIRLTQHRRLGGAAISVSRTPSVLLISQLHNLYLQRLANFARQSGPTCDLISG